MTRAFTPPDTLSKEDIRTIADVRRDIWTNAFWGMGVGSLSGGVLHGVGRMAQSRGMVQGGLNRNTAFLAVLGGGALGSFLMATTTGKNQVHNLHPIFEIGKKQQQAPLGKTTPYQQAIENDAKTFQTTTTQDRELKQIGAMQSRRATTNLEQDYDINKRRQIRASRRKTLQNTFERGHGLSDSHGGNWVEDRRVPQAER